MSKSIQLITILLGGGEGAIAVKIAQFLHVLDL